MKNLSNRGNYKVSFKKIKEQLQFESSMDLEEGIREIYNHFKKGSYKKPYNDPYYSSLEAARIIKRDYYANKKKKKR